METVATMPHDAVFKNFLTHTDTARDFLDIHLPEEIKAICDLSTLTLESGNFVEESLQEQYSDVLYSVSMQGHPGYLHILIEHQSTPSKKIAFRMMRYAIAAMHRHLEAGFQQLPLVVPILFYQGKTSPYPLLDVLDGYVCLAGTGATPLQRTFPSGGHYHHTGR